LAANHNNSLIESPDGFLHDERFMAVLSHQPLDDALPGYVDSRGKALVREPVLTSVPDLVAFSIGVMDPVGVAVGVAQQRVAAAAPEQGPGHGARLPLGRIRGHPATKPMGCRSGKFQKWIRIKLFN